MIRSGRTKSRRTGQALVPVLFVVFILTAFAVTVTLSSKRETRAAGAHLREAQQYYVARGAINYAAAALQEATQGGVTPPQLNPPPDTDANGWSLLGDGWFKLEIIDTGSRVNINVAPVEQLRQLPGLRDTQIPEAIIDWRDEDETGSGFESDHYQSLNPPYSAKNAPFDTVDELLLVSGVTPQILFGSPQLQGTSVSAGLETRSGRQGAGGQPQTPEEAPEGPPVDTSGSVIPLAELVTTYSKELNVASDGARRINVTSATAAQMQEAGIPQNIARLIEQGRQQEGVTIQSIADLLNLPGITRQVMQQIGDKITVTDDQFRAGMININTAPDEVMATIPGVDANVYNEVIDARRTGTTFTGLNDLFQLTRLNRRQLQALVDHVCTKSSVYLVRVKVRVPGLRKLYAAEALVELAPPPDQTQAQQGAEQQPVQTQQTQPRILQWREVPRTPGWSSWLAPPNYYAAGGTIGSQ